MSKVISGFDWDEGNLSHCNKHGVTVGEIERLFQGDHLVMQDPSHSLTEERLWAIGRTDMGRMIFVVFTFRQKKKRWLIRPISARYMHKKEVKLYEEKNSNL